MGGKKGSVFTIHLYFCCLYDFLSLTVPQGGSLILKVNTDVIQSPWLPNILNIVP